MASLPLGTWILVLFWLVVNVVRIAMDKYIPSARGRLERVHGISLGPIWITVHLRCFNQWINFFNPRRTFSKKQYQIYRQYFRFGILLSYLIFPYAIFILTKSFIQTIDFSPIFNFILGPTSQTELVQSNSTFKDPNLVILIPGVNISSQDMIYVIVACGISSVIHELGHAFAANRNKMRVDNFGFTLYLCFPLTFVSLASTDNTKSANRKLEVASAGILNNAVLCLVTSFLLIFNPLTLFYKQVDGLLVNHVDPTSQLSSGPNGLYHGDVIQAINGEPMSNSANWVQTLSEIAKFQKGLCIPEELIKVSPSKLCDLERCCGEVDKKSLCFVSSIDMSEDWDGDCGEECVQDLEKSNLHHYYRSLVNPHGNQPCVKAFCLAARAVLEGATQWCHPDGPQCLSTFYGAAKCLYPYSNDPSTRLVSIEVHGKDKQTLFWGPPTELFQVLSLSELEPRLLIIPINALYHWTIFLRYLFLISHSIILFNLLPYHPFDGYNILLYTTLYFFPEQSDQFHTRILKIANFISTLILCLFAICVVGYAKTLILS